MCMKNYKERIKRASYTLMNAEYILIGAGAGLSDAAGLKYSGKRFTNRFSDFIEKYGIEDLYSSNFYPFGKMEENGLIGLGTYRLIDLKHQLQSCTRNYIS